MNEKTDYSKRTQRDKSKNTRHSSRAKSVSGEFECIGYSKQGYGIIEYQGRQLEVFGLIKGEKAEIDLQSHRGGYKANIKKLKLISEDRVEPPCKHFQTCGACHLQHMSLELQEDFKKRSAAKSLAAYGKLKDCEMTKNPYSYRNKSHHTFFLNSKGKIVWGLYESASHKLVEISRCLIHDEKSDEIARDIAGLMEKYSLKPFDEDKLTGDIRHALIRVAKSTGDVLLCLVTNSGTIAQLKSLIKDIIAAHPEIKTVVRNINDRKSSMVLGNKEHILHGEGYVVDRLANLNFAISAKSFYQINRDQTEKLYQYACDIAKITKSDSVLDCYSGIGTISLIAAKKASKVVGVEVNSSAVKDAKFNAKINNMANTEFVVADAAKYMLEEGEKDVKFDVVFLDPPREGLSSDFVKALTKYKPNRIVYISCNPMTQARDLSQIKKSGYKISKLKAFDMFPFTNSVETVAYLERA